MTENMNTGNIKQIEDDAIESVSGGTTVEDLKRDADCFFEGLGEIVEATKINTCPICNQKIIPDAEKCGLEDFIHHYSAVHSKK